MRGRFEDQGKLFSYVSPEARVPADHPLRAMREIVRSVLRELHGDFAKLYSDEGRPSIPPEQMPGENARLGVETTTRNDPTARSATTPRSSSSIGQRHTARSDRYILENGQRAGPRMGSSSTTLPDSTHGRIKLGGNVTRNVRS